jgi:hypothetical protein
MSTGSKCTSCTFSDFKIDTAPCCACVDYKHWHDKTKPLIPPTEKPDIYKIRKLGKEYCQTEGSEHYKAVSAVEPIELIISKGMGEDFCLSSIIKYATRFKITKNLSDLKKIADYAHIMCGIELTKQSQKEESA